MKKSRLIIAIVLLGSVFGYFSCGFALQNGIAIPSLVYWFFFLMIPCMSVLLISDNENFNVLILLILSFSVYSQFFLQNQTSYPAARDTLFDMQLVSTIQRTGKWYPGMGTAMAIELSIYPLMYIFVASASLIIGINPYQLMFIIPWLKSIVFILFFYLFTKNLLFDKRMQIQGVFIASLIYLGCILYVGYPHPEVFSEIFFMGTLWIYTIEKKSFGKNVVFIILVFALAISHHFTSFIFLILISSIYLIRRGKETSSPLLPIIIVISWIMFVSWKLVEGYSIGFLNSLKLVLNFESRTIVGPVGAAISYYYTPLEFILMIANPALVGVLAFVSFINEIKNKRKDIPLRTHITITLVFSSLTILAVAFLFSGSEMATSAYRILGFLYIPLSIWISLLLLRKLKNPVLLKILMMVIVVILFASMSLSVMYGIKKWYVPRGYMETYRFSDSMVKTGLWSGLYLNGTIIGDNLAYNFVGSWGYKEVDSYAFVSWYITKDDKILKNFNYIILSPWDKSTYSDTFREPIDPFAALPRDLNVIYSSEDLVMYYKSP